MKAVYPDHTIAPSIETIFIDGYKFDICEFIKEARAEFNVRDKSRFFLMLEDNLLPFKQPNEQRLKAFGEYGVWGESICGDKAFLKSFIKDFEKDLEAVAMWQKRAEKSPVFTSRYNDRKIAFNERCGVKI